MTGRTTTVDRVIHALVYLSLAVAGAMYVLAAPATFSTIVSSEVVVLGGVSSFVGAVLGLASVATQRPWFEYLGLPLLLASMGVYIFAAALRIAEGESEQVAVAVVVIFIRVALMGLVGVRYLHVRRLIKGAHA